jgi:hypothetical protein
MAHFPQWHTTAVLLEHIIFHRQYAGVDQVNLLYGKFTSFPASTIRHEAAPAAAMRTPTTWWGWARRVVLETTWPRAVTAYWPGSDSPPAPVAPPACTHGRHLLFISGLQQSCCSPNPWNSWNWRHPRGKRTSVGVVTRRGGLGPAAVQRWHKQGYVQFVFMTYNNSTKTSIEFLVLGSILYK